MVLRRITADLDTRNFFKVMWFVSKALFIKPQRIELKESSSKGYHLIVWKDFIENPTQKQMFELRIYLGDDKYRIWKDQKRKFPKQVLFYKKE